MTQTGTVGRAIAIDEFLPMIGQALIAHCTPKPVELILVAVHPDRQQTTWRMPFTLIFRSAAAVQLIAGMYPLRCGEFGPETIYLEPMLPPRDAAPGNYYQAVFN